MSQQVEGYNITEAGKQDIKKLEGKMEGVFTFDDIIEVRDNVIKNVLSIISSGHDGSGNKYTLSN